MRKTARKHQKLEEVRKDFPLELLEHGPAETLILYF